MAVTAVVKSKAKVPGAERMTETEVTLDNSYPTGGEPLTAKECGLRIIDRAICIPKVLSESETVEVGSCWYDKQNAKLVVNNYKTQKELAAAKDCSKVVVTVYAWGR